MFTLASSSILISILDNPVVLDLLISALAFVLAWAGHKVLKLIDSKWANEHLTGVGRHIHSAAEVGAREYVRRIDIADDDGVVTADERKAARKAALDIAMAELSLKKLGSALSRSRGRGVANGAVEKWVEQGIDTALDQLLPGHESSSGEGEEPSPFDETAASKKP
jgi:hypothetical protein